jgi:hypothetical protein
LSRLDQILDRALEAEDRAEKAEKRVRDLEGRLRAALSADPTTASRALSWIGRAEQAERLIEELMRFIDQRAIDTRDFPGGWVARAQAQMRAVDILRRDQAEMAEKPENADEYWTTFVDSLERRGIVKDDTGWMHGKVGQRPN